MRIYGNTGAGGPMTGGSVPLPTAPTRYAGDPFTDLERAHRVHSPIGPSTKTRAELAALEQGAAWVDLRPTRARPARKRDKAPKNRDTAGQNRGRTAREPAGPPVARVVELYTSGLSATAVGEQLGCSPWTVFSRLKAAGVATRARGGSTSSVDAEQVAAAYAAGASLSSVAAQFSCARATVRRAVRDAGGTMRPSGGSATARTFTHFTATPDLIAAYQSGQTVVALADELGRGPGTLRRALRAAGVQLRDDRVWRNGGRNSRDYRELETDLRRLYVDEQLSIDKTAARLGLTYKVVHNALTRLGIPRRAHGQHRGFDTAAPVRQLMATNGVTAAQVRAWATRNNVPVGARGIPPESAVRGYLAHLKGDRE